MESLILLAISALVAVLVSFLGRDEEPLAKDFIALQREMDRIKERTDRIEEKAQREIARMSNLMSSEDKGKIIPFQIKNDSEPLQNPLRREVDSIQNI